MNTDSEQTMSIQNTNQTEVPKRNIEEAKAHIVRFGDPQLEILHQEWSEPRLPLVNQYKAGEETVTTVAVSHTRKVEHPTISQIQAEVEKYCKSTPKEKQVVLVEGFHDTDVPNFENLEEAVGSSGEQGATAYFAQENGSLIESPEVPREMVINKLKSEGVPEASIALFYTLRSLPSIMRQNETEKKLAALMYHYSDIAGTNWAEKITDEDLKRLIDNPQVRTQLEGRVFKQCIPEFNKAMEAITGKKLIDEETHQVLFSPEEIDNFTGPGSEAEDTPLRQISRIDNELRNDYILNQVDEKVKQGKSPFVVFGGSHILKLRPALGYLYN